MQEPNCSASYDSGCVPGSVGDLVVRYVRERSARKEMAPATIFMFAPYALCKRRSKRWLAASLFVPAVALFISLGLVRPHFARGESYMGILAPG